jgi:hypothetical protein
MATSIAAAIVAISAAFAAGERSSVAPISSHLAFLTVDSWR